MGCAPPIEGMVKKVLFVSYYVPPAPPVGCERVSQFRKHLPRWGYETLALGGRVWGTLSSDAAQGIVRPWEPLLLWRALSGQRPVPASVAGGIILPSAVGTPNWRGRLVQRLFVPDLQVTWLPDAVRVGLGIIRREKITAIVSSSPPVTNLLVGACLSWLTGVPLVLDFRDGWLHEPLRPDIVPGRARNVIESWLERWVVRRAAAVVTVSEPITAYFRARYALPAVRAVTITNGFDADDWQGVAAAPREGKRLRLVHTGAFTGSKATRSLEPLLRGLALLTPEVRAEVELLLVGNLKAEEYALVDAFHVRDVVHAIPAVPRAQALGYQLSADVLLLVTGPDKGVATSKLYEYLHARRPILVLGAADAAAAEIVRETRSGVVADWADPAAVAEAFIRFHAQWRAGTLALMEQGDIARYERRHLARQLAELFDQFAADGEELG
jgi:glycosyltransferase involved in cell wall biosynthesis